MLQKMNLNSLTVSRSRIGAIAIALAVASTLAGSIVAPGGALAQPATQPAAAEAAGAAVPVKQVVLFSSGVGYFEHFGTVNGDGNTELNFKTNQINDILKSLVLEDLDGGKVANVTYPSLDPIEKTLKSFQVDITANPSMAELLNQLRGAKVTVMTTDKIVGTILGVERKQRPGTKEAPQPINISVLNLISGGMIRSVEMDEVRSLSFDDAGLQQELNKALSALASARDQDKKPVTISFRGNGERRVRLGYVVETPIWKTSYRLLLPPGGGAAPGGGDAAAAGGAGAAANDKPKLQGWAIVENQTDNDWNNVQLSLVSGRPISFQQNLYQPLYIPRPMVQPELYASLRPQTYDAGMQERAKGDGRFGGARQELELQQRMRAPAAPSAASPARGLAKSQLADEKSNAPTFDLGGAMGGDKDGDGVADNGRLGLNAAASVSSLASASKMGELFQYTVGNVSLPRQKSAMIPIITDDVEVERLSIYNSSVLPRNPLNGARVKNTTGKHLLQGPITVLEGSSYAGDARIDDVPPGQERLLSYGVDLQMLVDATKNHTDSKVQSGKIVEGVLYVQRKHVMTQDYVAENKSDHDKTLIVEHPRRGDEWKLIETADAKPIEKTDALYRFRGTIPANKSSKLSVVEELVQAEAIAILPCDVSQIDFYVKTGEISQKVRESLSRAADLKRALVETQRQLNEKNAELQQVTMEQQRIRENMKTVNQSSQYYNRLLTKLNDQETAIEKSQTSRDELQKQLDQQQKDLEKYLSTMSVE